VLRGSERRAVAEGLQLESAVYGSLQAGPEFAAWRATHPVHPPRPEVGPAVAMRRDGDRLELVLNRPAVRNALDARMRDELVAGLAIAAGDPTVAEVRVRGEGPAFCAGGDLDEFGSRPDVATAHLVRMSRSPARAMAVVADRVVAQLHGACCGSGIELAAFAARVVARPDTVVGLPEVSLGLIPGAGGTTSLPSRIGRHRTAWLALTGRTIDATTALEWGLVDEIV
jgi:enoyl-CoA hydratase/carnithine racemase